MNTVVDKGGNLMRENEEQLINYNNNVYRLTRPLIAVGVLVFSTKKDTLQIKLIKCPEAPYEDKWCLPCTYIRVEENADEAAMRSLEYNTGLKDVSIEQLYTFSDVDRNPGHRIIMIVYMAMVPGAKLASLDGTENDKSMLFDIVRTANGIYLTADTEDGKIRLDKDSLLFDHAEMIKLGIERMAGKIDYSEIGFRFLDNPNRFTLTEVRHVYDAIKGSHSDIGNFRRFIKNRYIMTGKVVNNVDDRMEMEHAGRPAATFRYVSNDPE